MKPLASTTALSAMLSLGIAASAFATDCASVGKQRSKQAESATILTFVAKGSGQFKVYWIDYDGAHLLQHSAKGRADYATNVHEPSMAGH